METGAVAAAAAAAVAGAVAVSKRGACWQRAELPELDATGDRVRVGRGAARVCVIVVV